MRWHRAGRGAVAAVAIALGVSVAGCAHHTSPTAVTSTPSSSAVPGAGETPTNGAAQPGLASGGPVPKGFVARDLTFVGTGTGWLLGTAPCSSAPCTSLVRTSDGGRSWVGLPAPRAELEPNGQNGCSGHACVRGVRFASASVGYAYGSTGLYLTTDGGHTWTQQHGQADALEVANGTALRIGHDMAGCPPGCTYTISSAPVGSAGWTTVPVPGGPLNGNGVQLLRAGHHAYAAVYRNPAGGAGNAQATLLASVDDGQHWATHQDPCGTRSGQEGDTQQLAVAPDGTLTALCRVRSGGAAYVVTSTDGGTTFGAQHGVTGTGDADAIGSATASTLLVATVSGTTATLYRSTDGGGTWTSVATAPAGPTDTGAPGVIGFEDASTGHWVPGSATVLATTNGGATWAPYAFPA